MRIYTHILQVPQESLRWGIGTILAEGSETPNKEHVNLLLGKGYKLFELPAINRMVRCVFPCTTRLSWWFAVMKVYDPIAAYIAVSVITNQRGVHIV